MIALLVGFHLGNSLWQDSAIGPEDVPFVMVLLTVGVVVPVLHVLDLMILKRQFEVKQALSYKSNDIVLCIADVENEPLLVLEPPVLAVVLDAHRFGEHFLFCVI